MPGALAAPFRGWGCQRSITQQLVPARVRIPLSAIFFLVDLLNLYREQSGVAQMVTTPKRHHIDANCLVQGRKTAVRFAKQKEHLSE